MVKNRKGGSGHKKQARKNINNTNRQIRLPKDPNEIYARVTRLYGNGMASILCQDGVTRLLIIRKKFKGRNRRDNQITLGGVILAGLRSWEVVAPNKEGKTDLLFVYSPAHIRELRKDTTISPIIFGKPASQKMVEGGFEITDDPTRFISSESINKLVSTEVPAQERLSDEEPDWDDI